MRIPDWLAVILCGLATWGLFIGAALVVAQSPILQTAAAIAICILAVLIIGAIVAAGLHEVGILRD